MNIWSLPGPASFIDDIEHSVRNGLNVIARFSSSIPGGLERELRDRVHSIFEWISVDVSRIDADPLTLLRRVVCPDISVFEAGSIAELAASTSFQGKLVWIEGINDKEWSEWSNILRDYSDACRNIELLSRTVFIVLLSGRDVMREIPKEVALVCCDFRNIVDMLDIFVFALWKTPATVRYREHRALLAHTVAQVAQWDSLLGEKLLALPLDEALNPVGVLRQYSQDRGWTEETPRCWEMGTVDGPAERPIVHSALLEVSGGSRLVRQRVWAAQAAVLLPLVEERRIGLIDCCHRYLDLPIQIEDGRWVDDPFNLEVGQLAWYLDRPNKPNMLRKQVRRLRYIRNKLAHMEPLKPEQALHPMLLADP